MRRWKTRLGAVGLLVAVSACEVVDRARSRDAAGEEERVDAGATGLTLNLETPGSVRMGEQAAIHLAVTNGADTAVAGVRLELLLPPWMEPLVPEPAGTEVNLVASDEGTRLAYPFTTRPLQPGESRTIVQRIRAPAPSAGAANVFPGGVRASLAGLDGRPLGAQVESQLAIDTTRVGVPDSASAPGTDPTVSGDGVGA
ncbi:MAG: hypothetical protein M3409_04495, partial [Gemmatimonadota bacterium]|nr:hypothetical protein [Gemmatimonadota bacterium]